MFTKPAERFFFIVNKLYFRIKNPTPKFDKVASLTVEGFNKSIISKLTDPLGVPLITTDGYNFYDRVTKVNCRMMIGDKPDFEKALLRC